MRIVSRVAAAFYRRDHTLIFDLPARNLLVILDAPDEIRSDPLFDLLVKEGSLQVVNSTETQKVIEMDPKQGTNAEGRKISVPDPESDPEQQNSLPLKQGEVTEGRRGSEPAPSKSKAAKAV